MMLLCSRAFAVLLPFLGVSLAIPRSSVHVKFVSPPHEYAHGIEIAEDEPDTATRYVAQSLPLFAPSFSTQYITKTSYSRPQIRLPHTSLAPLGRVLSSYHGQPSLQNQYILQTSASIPQPQQEVYQELDSPADPFDPYLLTGETAASYVKYLFSKGELFWSDIPHADALERNNEDRRANNLEGNRLGSNREESPFFLYGKNGKAFRSRSNTILAL